MTTDIGITNPTDLMKYYIELSMLTGNGETGLVVPLVDVSYSKDVTVSTGDGSFNTYWDKDIYNQIGEGNEFIIREGWGYEGTTPKLYETVKGYIKSVVQKERDMMVDFTDKGVHLERTAVVSFQQQKRSAIIKQIITMAGLKAHIDWGDNQDDILDYTTATDTGMESTGAGAEGTVTFSGKPSCAYKCGAYNTVTRTYINKCPLCGKTGTLADIGKSGATEEHEITCSPKKGGCDGDFCINCGRDKQVPSRAKLTLADNSVVTNTKVPGNNTTSTSEVQSGKSYWDMLKELCDPVKVDLQIFVWIDTCYVMAVPPASSAVLEIHTEKNIVKDTITITDPKPDIVNKVVVNFGNKSVPQQAIAIHDYFYQKFGERIQQIDRYDLNATDAEVLAEKTINKQARENGFKYNCTAIGHPHFFINRWCKVIDTWHDYHDTLYISRFTSKVSTESTIKTDLELVEYYPLLESKTTGKPNTKKSTATGDLDTIARDIARRFRYSGACSTASCMEKVGSGDCFAMSEYLFNRLSSAKIPVRILTYYSPYSSSGTHRSVQIKQNGVWTDLNYRGYGFDSNFVNMTTKKNLSVMRTYEG